MNKSRIAIIDKDKCKPKKCHHECKKICPVNSIGKLCIEIEEIAKINTELCIGCGACVKKCPFNAIKIINIPKGIHKELVHSYGENLFKLYKLPLTKIGHITGIIGQNGCGKSTLIHILSNELIPNFGNDEFEFTRDDVLKNVRGTALQKYLTSSYNNKLKISLKHQDILTRLRDIKNKEITVGDILNKYNQVHNFDEIITQLDVRKIFDNKIKNISGGELQKLVCISTIFKGTINKSDVFVFDEPTNYLDIEYRIKIANIIKNILDEDKYIFVVDHDLSILEFLADCVHIIHGEPGAFGIVATLSKASEAINNYFDGYIPADNMRFRDEPYKLNDIILDDLDNQLATTNLGNITYESCKIELDNFILNTKNIHINNTTNIIVILGKNGTGKSTYLNYIKSAGNYNVSYKKQVNDIKLDDNKNDNKITVRNYLYNEIKHAMISSMFISDVINPLLINKLYNKKVKKLSGGEIQRLSIVLCLGKQTDIYLLDEPSASLDIEHRFNVIKVIKRFLIHNRKLGFIVEHDIFMAISLAKDKNSKIIIFEEEKKEDVKRFCTITEPLDFEEGINKFLSSIDTTFRTDKVNRRPKINKYNSVLDKEQKMNNKYYE